MRERRQSEISHYSELFRRVEKVLAELTRDAENHGFDVKPYLAKLAELELFDWPQDARHHKDMH